LTLLLAAVWLIGCGGSGGDSPDHPGRYVRVGDGKGMLHLVVPQWTRGFVDDIAWITVEIFHGTPDPYGPYEFSPTAGAELVVEGLQAGSQVSIEVKAYDAAGTLIGHGMTDEFTVQAGTQDVELRVDPLPTTLNIHVKFGKYPEVTIESARPPTGDQPALFLDVAQPCTAAGRAVNITPADHAVAVYIHVPGYGWVNKPYWAWPLTPISSDGTWRTTTCTGGHDEDADEVRAFLVRKDASVPILAGGETPPDLPDAIASAQKSVER